MADGPTRRRADGRARRGEAVVEIELTGCWRGATIGFVLGFGGLLLLSGALTAPPALRAESAAAHVPAQRPPEARLAAAHPQSAPAADPAALPPVAACVGGLLSLVVAGEGRSVALGVLRPLAPVDVFVAGTLNATRAEAARDDWRARVRAALGTIRALAPFAAAEVVPQPTRAELIGALRAKPRLWRAYTKQASGAGEGRTSAADSDPRLWLPTMLSPALGNPGGHTLRELHYQSRCMDMIEAHEARAGGAGAAGTGPAARVYRYERVLFTRLEMEWLKPHPPLELLDPAHTWIPAGEDNGGVNDRHWLAPRRAAAVLMRRWDALLDGGAISALHGAPPPGAPPHSAVISRFISSEMYLAAIARHAGLSIARFPMLSYLACCEESYVDAAGRGIPSSSTGVLEVGAGVGTGAKTCFQPHCNRKRCPRGWPLHGDTSARGEPGWCAFKYDDEGSAAILNAELLGLPGAELHRADGPPARLEIRVPRALAPAADRRAQYARFYFCMRCEHSASLTPVTNLTAGCLFEDVRYADADVATAASRHACRYFDVEVMRLVCGSFSRKGDAPDHRGVDYAEQYFPWWCKGLRSA